MRGSLTRSPRRSSTTRAASSALAGQARSRDTRAISASAAPTHRARATKILARSGGPVCARSLQRKGPSGISKPRPNRREHGHRGLRTSTDPRPVRRRRRHQLDPCKTRDQQEQGNLALYWIGKMVHFRSLQQTTCSDFSDDVAGMGRSLRLAARSGEPHAAHTADLHTGALRRAVRCAPSGHAHAVLPGHGIEARRGACMRGFGMSTCSPKAMSRAATARARLSRAI